MSRSEIINFVLSKLKNEEDLLRKFYYVFANVVKDFEDIDCKIYKEYFLQAIEGARSKLIELRDKSNVKISLGFCLTLVTNYLFQDDIIKIQNNDESFDIHTQNLQLVILFHFCLQSIVGFDVNNKETVGRCLNNSLATMYGPKNNHHTLTAMYELYIKQKGGVK